MLKKIIAVLLSCVLILCNCGIVLGVQEQPTAMYKTSFEDKSDTVWETKVTSYDTTEKHTGEKSLKYDREDTSNYELLVKRFDIPANTKYSVSVWAKTKGLANNSDKPTTFQMGVEYPQNKGNKYFAVKEDKWTKMDTGIITSGESTRITVVLYMAKGATGVAWIDDFEVLTYGTVNAPANGVNDKSNINVNSGVSQKEPTISVNNRQIKAIEEINFDKPDETLVNSDGSKVTYDNTVFRNGGGSLRLDRTDKASYVLTSKKLSCIAGDTYFISAWLKSEILQDGSGLFAMEFYDDKGQYLCGNYLLNKNGAIGTTDWTRYQSAPYKAPDNAAKILITFYMYKGAVGKVWFDDVKIYKEISNIMQTTLVTPGYRGVIWNKGNADIRLSTKINTNDYNTDNYKAVYRLVNESGKVVNGIETEKLSDSMDTTFSSSYLPVGKYKLSITIVEKSTEKAIENEEWPIDVKASDAQKPKSYVDENGQFILDNKPFFPLGMYFLTLNSNDLATYSDSPFNTILAYGATTPELYQAANEKGIKIIDSVKDYIKKEDISSVEKRVKDFKDQPALLAWYINDEIDINTHKSTLMKSYNIVKSNDQDHPTFSVDFRIPEISKQPMATDIFGTDIYPVYGKDSDRISSVAEATRASVKDMPNRPAWQIVQAMNHQNYFNGATHRPPTYEELRNMTWQTVCEGAQGIIYYSWFDIKRDSGGEPFENLWSNSKKVAQEVKDLVPVIMSNEFTPAIKADGGDWLSYIVKNYGNKTYIFATNNTKTANLQATFNLPSNATVKNITDNSTIVTGANKFTDTFPELGVRMYEVTLDENLSSNTDIKALSLSYNTQPLAFNVTDNEYKAYVPTSVDSLDLDVSLKDKNAKLVVNGADITVPTKVPLENDTNNIKLEIIAQDGKTKNTINIIVEKSSTTKLFDLTDSSGLNSQSGGFIDIADYEWAKEAIYALLDKKIINGTSNTTFEPAENITRADFIVMIMRALGLTEDSNDNFDDVYKEDYYYNAVGIAKKIGIAQGSNDNNFYPNENISRQDAFVLLNRAISLGEKPNSITFDLSEYQDVQNISSYAVESIGRLIDKGLIKGNDGYINPLNNLTRSEAAVLLHRIIK